MCSGQLYNGSDLSSFYKQYWPTGDASKVGMVGDAAPGRGGIESMLDIEYVTGMGGSVPTEFWGFTGTAPDNKENEPFLKWLLVVAQKSDAEVPQLFSTSYGEDEDSVTMAYASRIVVEFQKVGARGITLLFASGDSGAARDDGKCHKDGSFNSQWPAGSPWVTAVGATMPYQPDADSSSQQRSGGSTKESAASLSSGGFSDRWARPAWQDTAVSSYVSQLGSKVEASRFNHTGRGFPDISAQGVNFGEAERSNPANSPTNQPSQPTELSSLARRHPHTLSAPMRSASWSYYQHCSALCYSDSCACVVSVCA